MSLQIITEKSISAIEAFDAQGVELCLFIGRSPAEKGRSLDEAELPFPKNGNNVRWVSLSKDSLALEDLIAQWKEEWIHLYRDCNSDEEMKRLQGKFKIVAIDLSTTKFFNEGTLEKIVCLLKKGGTLFLPSQFQFIGVHETTHDGKPLFITDHFHLSVPEQKYITLNQKREACWDWHLDDLVGRDILPINGLIPPSKKRDIQLTMVHDAKPKPYKDWESRQKKFASWCEPTDKVKQYLDEYSNTQGIPSDPSLENETRMAREATKDRLLELFENTVICEQKYPYENRYDNFGNDPTVYYHATGKKE
jgi:hypothetical protein